MSQLSCRFLHISSTCNSQVLNNSPSLFHIQSRSPSDEASNLPSALNSSISSNVTANVTNPLPSTRTNYPSLSKMRTIALAVALPIIIIFITAVGICKPSAEYSPSMSHKILAKIYYHQGGSLSARLRAITVLQVPGKKQSAG